MSSNRDRFIRAGEVLFGPRWQTAMARTLGIDDSTVRKMLSGKRPIRDETVARAELLARRAKWVLGYGEDRDKYLHHTIPPRFTARVFQEGRDPTPNISGVTMDLGDGLELADFIWSDPVPDTQGLTALMIEARENVAAITADDADAVEDRLW